MPAELGHAEKVVEKLGPQAEHLLVKESYGYGHLAAAQTAAVYGRRLGHSAEAGKRLSCATHCECSCEA